MATQEVKSYEIEKRDTSKAVSLNRHIETKVM
jgi:hypothetical protein